MEIAAKAKKSEIRENSEISHPCMYYPKVIKCSFSQTFTIVSYFGITEPAMYLFWETKWSCYQYVVIPNDQLHLKLLKIGLPP